MIELEDITPIQWFFAGLSAVATGLFGVFGGIDPALAFLSSTSGLWFPTFSVLGGIVLPEFGYAEVGSRVALVAALVFIGIKGAALIERGAERLQERRN